MGDADVPVGLCDAGCDTAFGHVARGVCRVDRASVDFLEQAGD